MYVAIGYAVGSDFGGFTMWSSLFAGTEVTALPAAATFRMLGLMNFPAAFLIDANCRWFATANAVSV